MARHFTRLFDVGIAAFAAVAIGFAVFAMPEWRLFSLLQLTGLPDLLSAANPPLGLKARLGVASLFAAGAFGAVFMLMRLLDRVPAPRTAEEFDEEAQAVNLPIRLRRADAHPDNPARRPLIAGRELGEPFEELLLEVRAEPGQALSPPPEPLPEPIRGRPLPSVPVFEDGPLVPARTEDVAEIVESAPAPDAGSTATPTFQPVAFAAPAAPVPAASPVAEPITPPPPIVRETIVAAPVLPEPVAEIAPPPVPGPPEAPAASVEESISGLMARLESGLRRRERAHPGTVAASSPSPLPDESIADRLRSAMTDLQKLAVRS